MKASNAATRFQQRHYLLGVLVLAHAFASCFVWGDAAEHDTASTTRCIRSAPRQLSADQAKRLCIFADALDLDDGPARCASTALKISYGVTSKADTIADVISLCERAEDTRPADCWTVLPRDWRALAISVCKNAIDDRPAQCLLEFKRHGVTARHTKGLATVVQVCSDFGGDPAAIGSCLKRAPPSLRQALQYQLCRGGNYSTIGDVVDCAKQLLQRHANAEIVAHVCASAETTIDSPQECVLAAQQQLRWMDVESVGALCRRSQATSAPVDCVTSLRSWYTSEFSRSQSLADLATLCQTATPSDSIVKCVKKLPSQLFTASQVVRLCGKQHGRNDGQTDRADCVVAASRQLSRMGGDTGATEDRKAELMMDICGGDSMLSSLECVVATEAQNPLLSFEQRVRLCKDAPSVMPHRCLRAIPASIIQRLPRGLSDAVELCREAASTAPAQCINQLHHMSATAFAQAMASKLCTGAISNDPVDCFFAAPYHFSDSDRVSLCTGAESDEPVACAKWSLPRLPADSDKAMLCAKAVSIGPAQCASLSPFGMAPKDIITLCRQALNDKPARCANSVPPYLLIQWSDIASACRDAVSLTPGSCISHRVRNRVPLTPRVIHECRSTASSPSALEIARFAYECPQLMTKCPFSMEVRVLDQFGDDMPSWSQGYVHFSVVPDQELLPNENPVRGLTYTPVVNGSALFHGLHFLIAGNFTLRLQASGVQDMIARLRVQSDESEQRVLDTCRQIFSFLQCEKVQSQLTPSPSDTSFSALEVLMLPRRLVLSGLHCESVWVQQYDGLRPLGSTAHARLYALPRMTYQLLTGLNIPTRAMSAWACLGIPEGSNRSVIRRAYHKRSLEWHPDKWVFSSDLSSTSASPLRAKVEEVYSLVNYAYQQLFNRAAHLP